MCRSCFGVVLILIISKEDCSTRVELHQDPNNHFTAINKFLYTQAPPPEG